MTRAVFAIGETVRAWTDSQGLTPGRVYVVAESSVRQTGAGTSVTYVLTCPAPFAERRTHIDHSTLESASA